MPSIKRQTTTSANAIANLRFTNPKSPTAVSIWATGATAGDTMTFGVDDLILVEDARINLESANEVVDTTRDQILFREPCPPGQYVLSATGTADMNFLLVQEVL